MAVEPPPYSIDESFSPPKSIEELAPGPHTALDAMRRVDEAARNGPRRRCYRTCKGPPTPGGPAARRRSNRTARAHRSAYTAPAVPYLFTVVTFVLHDASVGRARAAASGRDELG